MSKLDDPMNKALSAKNLALAASIVLAFGLLALILNDSSNQKLSDLTGWMIPLIAFFGVAGLIVHLTETAQATTKAKAEKAKAEAQKAVLDEAKSNSPVKVVDLKEGYDQIKESASKFMNDGDVPLRVYIHNLAALKKHAGDTEYVWIQEFLDLVCENILKAAHKAQYPDDDDEEEKKDEDDNKRIVKTTRVCIFHSDKGGDVAIRESERDFHKLLVDKYKSTYGYDPKDDPKAEVVIKSHVQSLPVELALNANSVILVGKDNAKLFAKLNDEQALLTEVNQHFLSQIFSSGLDRLFERAYRKHTDSLIKRVKPLVVAHIPSYKIGDNLYDKDVVTLFAQTATSYTVVSLSGYCVFLRRFKYKQDDGETVETTLAEVLLGRKVKEKISLTTFVVDQTVTDIKSWFFKSKYLPGDFQDHLKVTKSYFKKHRELGTPLMYRHPPLCRLVFIGEQDDKDRSVLVSFYNDFDYDKEAFTAPVYHIKHATDQGLYNEFLNYYETLTFLS